MKRNRPIGLSAEPYYANRWLALLDVAREILAEREVGYPAWIAAGKMDQEQADTGIRIAAAIVADWQRIVDLYAGREAAPLDRTATTAEKLATYTYVQQRAEGLFRPVEKAFWQRAGAQMQKDLANGFITNEDIYEAWKDRRTGYTAPEFDAYFAGLRRYGATTAMLWHAGLPRGPMFYAECQAELIARERQAKAA